MQENISNDTKPDTEIMAVIGQAVNAIETCWRCNGKGDLIIGTSMSASFIKCYVCAGTGVYVKL